MLVFLLHVNSCAAKTYSREIMLFFLYFFVWLPIEVHPPPLSHRKDSWNCSFTERKKLKARTFFFSVRFEKIILIMILLVKGKMWLLKMDLWKNSYPQKNISRCLTISPLLRWLYSLNSRAHIRVLKASKSESHNPRPQVPLHVPSRLHSWNFGIFEAELIWQGD